MTFGVTFKLFIAINLQTCTPSFAIFITFISTEQFQDIWDMSMSMFNSELQQRNDLEQWMSVPVSYSNSLYDNPSTFT